MNSSPQITPADFEQKIASLQKEIELNKQQLFELKQRSDVQTVLNSILNISLHSTSLNEQLDEILQLILSLDWLSLQEKGCFFLKDEQIESLTMVAHHNLGESLLTMCDKVAYGRCLCGKAAQSQELIFKHCLDAEHENRPHGITEHGHYVIPIISNNKTLGVLNLYVKYGHKQSDIEVEYLTACGNAIAGIIERKQMEKKLEHLSLHDDLTGLPNRRHLLSYIEQLMKSSKRNKKQFAVLFIDLDGFKSVNDKNGHAYGDEILKQSSKRIRDFIRESDILARLGGDEFVVITENLEDTDGLLTFGKKLIDCISKPYSVNDMEIIIGSSIGISLYPEHGIESDNLLLCADKALYRAKGKRGEVMLHQ